MVQHSDLCPVGSVVNSTTNRGQHSPQKPFSRQSFHKPRGALCSTHHATLNQCLNFHSIVLLLGGYCLTAWQWEGGLDRIAEADMNVGPLCSGMASYSPPRSSSAQCPVPGPAGGPSAAAELGLSIVKGQRKTSWAPPRNSPERGKKTRTGHPACQEPAWRGGWRLPGDSWGSVIPLLVSWPGSIAS